MMLKTFKLGGVHPAENKFSADKSIEVLPLPKSVTIPVSQHIGAPATVVVAKGDMVKVIAGKDKDKEGKVVAVDKKNGKVTVEKVNIITKHTKPSAANQNGGIIQMEAPIDASNVMYLHNGKATRIGFKVEDGKKVRVAKSTGEVIDK